LQSSSVVPFRALGRKVSDEFTVPLCRGHHREVHRCGDEAAWWKSAGINPTVAARALWLETHPLPIGPDILPAADLADPCTGSTVDRANLKLERQAGGHRKNHRSKSVGGTLPQNLA
jgi:hypothetical protein